MAVAFLGRNMRSAVPQLQEPAVPRETRDDERRRLVAVVRDRYDIQRELGRGGMSSVFVAWDRRGRRRVAIKLLAAGLSLSVEHRERFRREAWITTRLAHPHIVPCYDFVRSGDVVYTVMPYIAGRSLAALLAGGRRLEAATAIAVFAPIADALAHAHPLGVVHRDVKPATTRRHSILRLNLGLGAARPGMNGNEGPDVQVARAAHPAARYSQS